MVKNTELAVPGFCESTGADDNGYEDNGDEDNGDDAAAALEVG